MPSDALLTVAAVTSTAAATGIAQTLPGGTPRRGLKVRFVYSAASTTAGAGSAQFGVDVSYDAGSTWKVGAFQANAIVLSTTAGAGEIFIPVEFSPTSVANGTQWRPALEAISGTNATITYTVDPMLARP